MCNIKYNRIQLVIYLITRSPHSVHQKKKEEKPWDRGAKIEKAYRKYLHLVNRNKGSGY